MKTALVVPRALLASVFDDLRFGRNSARAENIDALRVLLTEPEPAPEVERPTYAPTGKKANPAYRAAKGRPA